MGAQRLIDQGYGGYAGWGDVEAEADFKATGGGGKKTAPSSSGSSTSGGSAGYSQSAFDLALKMQSEAAAPVVSALESQRAAVPAQFATQKTALESQTQSLKSRYDNILASMARRQKVSEAEVDLEKSREYGRRGVPLSSGMFEQDLRSTKTPIREFFGEKEKDISLEQETALMGLAGKIASLPSEEEKMKSDLDVAIGMAKQGNSQQAINILMSMGASAQAASQFISSQSQSASQFEKTLAENTRQFNLEFNKPKAASTGTAAEREYSRVSNLAASDIKNGKTLEAIVFKYGDSLSRADILDLYDKYSRYGPHKQSVEQLQTMFGADEL